MNKSAFSQSHPEQAKWKKYCWIDTSLKILTYIYKKLCPALGRAIKYGDSLSQQVSQNPAKHDV